MRTIYQEALSLESPVPAILAAKQIGADRLNRVVLFGQGKVGEALIEEFANRGIELAAIVRQRGIFSADGKQIAEHGAWKEYISGIGAAFIAIPTIEHGDEAREYSETMLEQGILVVTAEKASLASYPKLVRRKDGLLRYTAAVGGGTRMLKIISQYPPSEIRSVWAVLNGSLNYVSYRMQEGATREQAMLEAADAGYMETRTTDLEVFVADESQDVRRKLAILANRCLEGGCKLIQWTRTDDDIKFVLPASVEEMRTKRCAVRITEEGIQAGFIEDANAAWLPKGVNNTLYINGKEAVTGAGAGPAEAARVMIEDYEEGVSSRREAITE